jgi:hypothetical protein
MDLERLSDQELLVLAREAPQAFAAFYRRHVLAVHGYFRRRVFEVEAAFDLTAETFATALRAVPHYEPRPEPARGGRTRASTTRGSSSVRLGSSCHEASGTSVANVRGVPIGVVRHGRSSLRGADDR